MELCDFKSKRWESGPAWTNVAISFCRLYIPGGQGAAPKLANSPATDLGSNPKTGPTIPITAKDSHWKKDNGEKLLPLRSAAKFSAAVEPSNLFPPVLFLFLFMITYEDNKAPMRLNVIVRLLVVVFIRILLILPWEEAEKFCFKTQCALIECSHLSICW